MVTREEVRTRDGDRCARCGSPRDLHVHHRITRAQGGRDYGENLVTLCALCHHWAHMNPYAARDAGWLLKSTDNPGRVPVSHFMWPYAPVWLGPDLTIILTLDEFPEEERRAG